MGRLRLLLLARPFAALWLVACVLAVRMLVPAGFMPVVTDGGIVLGLCPGAAPVVAADHHAIAGMHHGGDKHHEPPPTGSTSPCAFVGVGVAAVDLPALALAAVVLLVALPMPVRAQQLPTPLARARWRPPLRAPPLG